jgi:hypothetical protein
MLGNCCKSLQSESTHATSRWFHSVEKVIAEIDLERLLQRVYAAEEALFVRWSELSACPNHETERRAMESAANNLLRLRLTCSVGPVFESKEKTS